MLLETRVDISPGIDTGHHDPGITLMMRKSATGFEAFNQAVHIAVICQGRIRYLFGNYLGVKI